jgi:polyhydroxybutyrate depolymerase
MIRSVRTRACIAVLAIGLLAQCSSAHHAARTSSAAPTPTTVSSRSAGCSRPPPQPGLTVRTLRSNGSTRTYQLNIPASYNGRSALPVVFTLHALSVSYTVATALAGFNEMAKRYAYIGVSPSGRLNGPTPFWLAAPVAHNYDVQFIGDLLDWLEANLCIDPTRIYSTGQSNGAQMSSVLACQLSDRITAVAPVDGVEFYDVCRGRPVPVIAFHGTADPFVPYRGGGLDSETIADENLWKGRTPANVPVHHGVDAAMQTWAVHNGCAATPIEWRVSRDVRERTWQHCKADTIPYIVDGGGHTWPGHPVPGFASFGRTTMDIDATMLLFRFFFAQRRA